MEEIKKWIIDCYSFSKLSINSCLFVSGVSGCGKSYIISKIIKDMNLFPININSNNCSSSSQLLDLLTKSFVSSLIQILTNNNSNKIIVIDDFDVLTTFDSTINLTLYNFINNSKLKNIPIIVIINNEIIKKIGEIKKKCRIIEIKKLCEYDIYEILKIYKNDLEFGDALRIINESNYNVNEAIKIVNKNNYNNNDIFISSSDLYNSGFNRNNLKLLLLKEQWIIPLNFHENLIYELTTNRKGTKKDKDEFYKFFIYNFCYFDIFMNKNYDYSIDLFISIIKELYEFPLKKNSKNKNNFTKMLSYLSLQKKNNKFVFKSSFPFNQINNYHSNIINRKFIY